MAGASSLMQLDELDTLLQEHHALLRERVERLREDKRREHEEWFTEIQTLLPTPQKERERVVPDALVAPSSPMPPPVPALSSCAVQMPPGSPPRALSAPLTPPRVATSPPRAAA